VIVGYLVEQRRGRRDLERRVRDQDELSAEDLLRLLSAELLAISVYLVVAAASVVIFLIVYGARSGFDALYWLSFIPAGLFIFSLYRAHASNGYARLARGSSVSREHIAQTLERIDYDRFSLRLRPFEGEKSAAYNEAMSLFPRLSTRGQYIARDLRSASNRLGLEFLSLADPSQTFDYQHSVPQSYVGIGWASYVAVLTEYAGAIVVHDPVLHLEESATSAHR